MIRVLVDSPADLVPDVATAAGAGAVALAAASAARTTELDGVARSACAIVGISTTLIVVDTLELLICSRRIGQMQSWSASLADLKPLLQSVDGGMTAAELGPVIACHTGPGAVGLVCGQV